MNINQLIENTTTVYREALQTGEERKLDIKLNSALKESANDVMKIKEKHESLNLPEDITKKVIEAAVSEHNAIQNLKNTLTKTNTKEILNNATNAYLEGVKQFTNAGGKNFYDIGTIVSFRDKHTSQKFDKHIKKLQEQGMDIKILKEKHIEHEKVNRFTTSAIYSLVLPSSQYSEFESFIVKNLPEEDGLTLSRQNFFIPPFVKGRQSISKLEEDIIKNEKDIDYYNFTPYGYSTIRIDINGGYGKFFENSPEVSNLKEAVNDSLRCVTLYENKHDHVNGMMPTLACYGEEDLKRLNFDGEDTIRKTIVKDIKLDDLDQNEKLEKSKKRSYSKA